MNTLPIATNSATRGIIQPIETIQDISSGSPEHRKIKKLPGKQVNRIKLAKYKTARKKGESITKSLKKAGMADSTAEHKQNVLKLVKVGDAEIAQELKAKDIDADWLVKEFENLKTKALSIKQKNDLTNANRSVEAIARVVNIGSNEKQVINITNVPTNEEEFTQRILDRLKSVKT